MNSPNENGMNFVGALNLSTTDAMAKGTESIFYGMMDPNRAAVPDICEIPAQLEEILKNVCDIHSNENGFNPDLNSTISPDNPRMFEQNICSTINDYPANSSTDNSYLYITPNTDASTSAYFTPNLSTDSNHSLVYHQPETCDNFTEYIVDSKQHNNTALSNNHENDNDSSPVYLNFNIQNMAQSVQTFNTEFEKYTNQTNKIPNFEKKNNEMNYIEYMNNMEQAWQPQLVEMNAQQNQIFRPITTNKMPVSLKNYPIQKIYNFPRDMEKLNSNGPEVMSQFQSLNNNAIVTNYNESRQQNLPNMERQIISRNPLRTRLSVKIKNSEWAIINDKTTNEASESVDIDSELLAIDQTDPDIPFIKVRQGGRKRRKQSLIPLKDNDISFMNNRGEFSKFEQVDLPESEIKIPSDTTYITFRKKTKMKGTPDSSVDSLKLAGRSNTSTNRISREGVVKKLLNSSAIIVSSDSDSVEDIESPNPKCLKCNHCKKMFKTSRAYSIHKKRCDPLLNHDNAYMIEVEYLESEKEDDYEVCDADARNIKFTHKSIEIVESDSIESLEIVKEEALDEPEKQNENNIRRNTRSSSLKSNPLSSASASTSGSPSKSSLKKSRKAYTGNKRSIMPNCDICGKSFRQKSYLLAHKRTHEKSFKCQYCLKTFLIKTAYDTHVIEKCDKIPSAKLKRLRSTVTMK